jgi:hypothetical protein
MDKRRQKMKKKGIISIYINFFGIKKVKLILIPNMIIHIFFHKKKWLQNMLFHQEWHISKLFQQNKSAAKLRVF